MGHVALLALEHAPEQIGMGGGSPSDVINPARIGGTIQSATPLRQQGIRVGLIMQ